MKAFIIESRQQEVNKKVYHRERSFGAIRRSIHLRKKFLVHFTTSVPLATFSLALEMFFVSGPSS